MNNLIKQYEAAKSINKLLELVISNDEIIITNNNELRFKSNTPDRFNIANLYFTGIVEGYNSSL